MNEKICHRGVHIHNWTLLYVQHCSLKEPINLNPVEKKLSQIWLPKGIALSVLLFARASPGGVAGRRLLNEHQIFDCQRHLLLMATISTG